MKYLVIGLGNLGRAIAESLTRIGNEVIGVDINPHKTEAVKHTISGAISLDTTDKDALNTLPLNEMDAIFVTFGKDFGTSIQTVALLKKLRCEQTDRTRDFSHPRGSDPFDRCSGDHHSGR